MSTEPVPVDDVSSRGRFRSAGALSGQLFGDRLGVARAYAELLGSSGVEWGLVGPREVPRIWERHVVNCVVVAPALADGVRVADVGSGAGLPGLVLAIARPDVAVTLIEPLLRRVNWLQMAVDELALPNVTVLRSRAEDVTPSQRGFDVVTARAVAPLPRLLGWCLPLLRPAGELLALKGESVLSELAEAEPELRASGAERWTVEEFGAGLVDPPTRVARVVLGDVVPSVGGMAASGGSGVVATAGRSTGRKAKPGAGSDRKPGRRGRGGTSDRH